MKLYFTPGSPYARMARIMVIEKGLQDRVEIAAARTRIADSPYYRINPSGRVPYLLLDDGAGLEESAVVCAYLDHLDGAPRFDLPAGAAAWPARRLTLGCALGLEARNPDFRWRPGHPKLGEWSSGIASRASFAATRPPGPP